MGLDEKNISYLILGSRGGSNRVKIIKLLEEHELNINQMATHLGLNYRTVQHHVDLLEKNGIVLREKKEFGYGETYCLDIDDDEREVLNDIISRFEEQEELTSATNSLGFFTRIVKRSNEGMMIIDREQKVFFTNRSAEKLLGYDSSKLIGSGADRLMNRTTISYILERSGKKKGIGNMRVRMTHSSGKQIDVSLTMDPIENKKGDIIGQVLMLRDDSRQRKVEEKLRKTMERYRFLFDDAPSINIILDDKGHILEMNKICREVLGYSGKETKKNIRELIPDADESKRFMRMFGRIKKEKLHKEIMELNILSKDGSKKNISFISGRLLTEPDDQTRNIYLTGIDLTELRGLENGIKRAQRERNIKEENLRALASSTPVGIVFLDAPDGKVSFMNSRAEELYGLSELRAPIEKHSHRFGLYRPGGESYPPEELPASRALLKGETVENEEVLISRSDGTKIPVMANARPIKDEYGNIVQSVGIFWDITELRRTKQELDMHRNELEQQNRELMRSQKELEESRNEYSDMFDHSPIGLFKLDEYGIIMDVNETGADLLRKPRNHLLDSPMVHMFNEKDQDDIRKMIRDVHNNNGKRRMRKRIDHDDGDSTEFLLTASLVKKNSEAPSFFYLSMLDM